LLKYCSLDETSINIVEILPTWRNINQYCWNTAHLTLNLNKWVILWQLLQ
jgi:hypothetical protein